MTTDRPPPTLAEALAYQNPDIVERFLDDWELEPREAQALFDDVKRWLWLVDRTRPIGSPLLITSPLLMLDEMWHAFVLFTAEYTDYCRSVFGQYLHHAPATHREAARAPAEVSAQLHRQRELVLEHLGIETLLRWYVDYPARFDNDFLARGRRALRSAWKPDAELLALADRIRAGRAGG